MQRPWFDFDRLHGRLFAKGDLKYVVLQLLSEHPTHGYEVMRALEDRFGGMYTPSAGAVYPTLQMLEDMGYVTAAQEDGKKVYSLTDEGRTFLAERKDVVEGIRQRTGALWNPQIHRELHEMRHELKELVRGLGRRARPLTEESVHRIHEVIERGRREIEEILADKK